jgi:hypothetical protein
MSGFSFYNYRRFFNRRFLNRRFKRPRLKLNYCERLRSRLTGTA